LALPPEPAVLMVGTIVRNRSGVVLSAAVVWPDGDSGTYVADEIDERAGAADAYHVTYGVIQRSMQDLVSLDGSGRVTHRPATRVL